MKPLTKISYALENFPVRVTTRMLRNGSVWLRDQNGDTAYRDSLIVQAMDITRQRLTREFGADPAGWQWGNLHTVTFSPIIFREAAADSTAPLVLKSIVQTLLSKGPYPVGGHAMSVNNTQYSWEQPFAQILGASIRRIVDLGEPGRSLSVLPTGQSGHALFTALRRPKQICGYPANTASYNITISLQTPFSEERQYSNHNTNGSLARH